jgi:hypothetical protein
MDMHTNRRPTITSPEMIQSYHQIQQLIHDYDGSVQELTKWLHGRVAPSVKSHESTFDSIQKNNKEILLHMEKIKDFNSKGQENHNQGDQQDSFMSSQHSTMQTILEQCLLGLISIESQTGNISSHQKE